MKLITFCELCAELPQEYKQAPAHEIKLTAFKGSVFIFHQDKKPMVFKNKKWSFVEARHWQ